MTKTMVVGDDAMQGIREVYDVLVATEEQFRALYCYPYPAHPQPTPAKAIRPHIMGSNALCTVCGRHEVTIMMSGGMLGDECPGPANPDKEPRPIHGIIYQPQADKRYPTISDLWVSGRT